MKADVPSLSVQIAGVEFQNPVLAASGTFGYGEEYAHMVDLNRLGGIVVKGLTLKPRAGHPAPRIYETPAGMLNAIGLQNIGLEAFVTERLPRLRQYRTRIIANIFGEDAAEYEAVARGLDGAKGLAAIEVNVSCPNVKKGGMEFGRDPVALQEVVRAVRGATRLPLIVKLSPNVTDMTEMARVAHAAGADALAVANTFLGMAIDAETRRPRLANVTGGLSGPAIRPLALRMVWECARAVNLPIIGIGGILTAEDAVEFLLAGATAVAIGTGNFINPRAPITVLEGLGRYLSRHGMADIRDLIGAMEA